MATEEQIMKKVDEMLNREDTKKRLFNEALRLLDNSYIDYESLEDDYVLPKILLSIALKNESWQYSPLAKEHKKIYEELIHI